MALSVAVVSSDIKEVFLESLIEKVSKLKIGFEDLNANSFGPLVSKNHLNSVKKYIKMAKEGARVLIDGRDTIKKEKF